jgi:hypothetical protein
VPVAPSEAATRLTQRLNAAYDRFLAALPAHTSITITQEGWHLATDPAEALSPTDEAGLACPTMGPCRTGGRLFLRAAPCLVWYSLPVWKCGLLARRRGGAHAFPHRVCGRAMPCRRDDDSRAIATCAPATPPSARGCDPRKQVKPSRAGVLAPTTSGSDPRLLAPRAGGVAAGETGWPDHEGQHADQGVGRTWGRYAECATGASPMTPEGLVCRSMPRLRPLDTCPCPRSSMCFCIWRMR